MFSCTNSRKDDDGNPIIDNELFQDSAISIQPGSPVWMSPDIGLNDPSLVKPGKSVPAGRSPYVAEEGVDNLVTVRVRKAGNPVGTTSVFVDLFVAPPSLNPAIASAQPIFLNDVLSTSGVNSDFKPDIALTSQTWTAQNLPANSDPIDPLSRQQHFCLVARCYPSTKNPPTQQFCVGQDPHVAQRNIMIKRVVKNKMLRFSIQTRSNSPELVEKATIRAFADRVPSTAVLNAILPSLKQFVGFQQIAQIAPEKFALQVPDRFSPVIRDKSQLEKITPINPGDIPIRDTWRYVFRDGANFGRFRDAVFTPNVVLQEAVAVRKFNTSLNVSTLRVASNVKVVPKPNFTPGLEKLVERAAPTFEADIKLPPQEVANFTFTANLPENSQTGDAHIFHVMHINEQQQVIGGLTIVAVVVDSVNPELVDALNNQRNQLIRNGYFAIFGNQPGTSSREIATCLRDLNYAFEPIIECCRQGSTQPLDQIIPGLKETFSSLGFPTNWFITFYQFIKQNHGLTDAFANIVNPYLDHAINLMS